MRGETLSPGFRKNAGGTPASFLWLRLKGPLRLEDLLDSYPLQWNIPPMLRKVYRMLPLGLRWKVRDAIDHLTAYTFAGDRYQCPICGKASRSFRPQRKGGRPNSRCPWCNSLERHRLCWLYLKRHLNITEAKDLSLLHFAPEKGIEKNLRKVGFANYQTADISIPHADLKFDIIDIPLADETYDLIICSHILEHIEDDRKAMSELYRILKPGGKLLVMVPMDGDTTQEDLSITDPAERKRLYGTDLHVRMYGRDIVDRLNSVGFSTTTVTREDICSPDEMDHFLINHRTGDIFVCAKS